MHAPLVVFNAIRDFPVSGFWILVAGYLLISSLWFKHGFTARFARVAKIAEKRLFNFLLRGQKVKNTCPSSHSIACYFQSVMHKQLLAFEAHHPLYLPSFLSASVLGESTANIK
jgi:hypothetical protein